MRALITSHGVNAWAMTVLNGMAGIWSGVLALKKKQPGPWLDRLFILAFVSVYVQVAVGAYLWSKGIHPREATHILYGVTPAVGIFVILASRSSIERRQSLVYAVMCLAIMGMGIRGLMTGYQ